MFFQMGRISWGFKNEFESAMVNERSVCVLLRFYLLYLVFSTPPLHLGLVGSFYISINKKAMLIGSNFDICVYC